MAIWRCSEIHIGSIAFCFACALSALAMKYLDSKYPYNFDSAKWGAEDEIDEIDKNEDIINEKSA